MYTLYCIFYVLASRVQDFQDQLSSLRHPLEYSALHEFLKHRVHLCFLSFYVAVFQRMKDSCLSTGREETYYVRSLSPNFLCQIHEISIDYFLWASSFSNRYYSAVIVYIAKLIHFSFSLCGSF